MSVRSPDPKKTIQEAISELRDRRYYSLQDAFDGVTAVLTSTKSRWASAFNDWKAERGNKKVGGYTEGSDVRALFSLLTNLHTAIEKRRDDAILDPLYEFQAELKKKLAAEKERKEQERKQQEEAEAAEKAKLAEEKRKQEEAKAAERALFLQRKAQSKSAFSHFAMGQYGRLFRKKEERIHAEQLRGEAKVQEEQFQRNLNDFHERLSKKWTKFTEWIPDYYKMDVGTLGALQLAWNTHKKDTRKQEFNFIIDINQHLQQDNTIPPKTKNLIMLGAISAVKSQITQENRRDHRELDTAAFRIIDAYIDGIKSEMMEEPKPTTPNTTNSTALSLENIDEFSLRKYQEYIQKRTIKDFPSLQDETLFKTLTEGYFHKKGRGNHNFSGPT